MGLVTAAMKVRRVMRRLSGVVVLVLAVGLLVPVGTVTAFAGDERPSRVVLADDRRDVWFWDDSPGGETLVGQKRTVDVLRAVAAHRPRVVTSKIRVIDLRRVGRFQEIETRIQTPANSFAVWVQAKRGNWAGRHVLFSFDTGERVRCPGLTHDIDYEVDRVTVSVPRRCLESPIWVRLRLQNSLGRRDGAYFDNPHNDRAWPGTQKTIRLYHP
jgi:hypothetical protein